MGQAASQGSAGSRGATLRARFREGAAAGSVPGPYLSGLSLWPHAHQKPGAQGADRDGLPPSLLSGVMMLPAQP